MKKIIHVKILDESITKEDVDAIAQAIKTGLEKQGLNEDYAFLITANFAQISIEAFDDLIEKLRAHVVSKDTIAPIDDSSQIQKFG